MMSVPQVAGLELDTRMAEMIEPKPSDQPCPDLLSQVIAGKAPRRSPNGAWFVRTSGYYDGDRLFWAPRPYSLSIEAAWQIVEHMRRLGWGMAHIMAWPLSSVLRGHNVQFYKGVYPPKYGEGHWEEGDKGRSFPLAVCLAALSAIDN